MCAICILRCSCLACADCPYWLVSDCDLSHILSTYALKTNFELSCKDILKLAAFSFFECLTYTEVNIHAFCDSKKNL